MKEVVSKRHWQQKFDMLAVLALALTAFAWMPLVGPFYFKAHDSRHALFYAVEFFQSVAEGYLVPRWGPDFAFGRGYPVFVFYSPLSLYIVQSFRYVGLGVVASVKAAYVVGFLFGAAGMYRLARRWFGRQAALLSTLAFTYLPYHLVDIYVRGALAEFWALAWFPWVLLAADALVERPDRRRVAAFGLAYGALIWVHSLTAILFTPFLGLFLLARWLAAWRDARALPWRPALGIAGGVGLGLWVAVGFLVPNVAEQKYIALEQWTSKNYQYDKQFVYPGQFLSPFWGFGYAVEGPEDGMSFQLGVVGVGLVAGAIWLALRDELSRRQRELVWLFAAQLLLLLWAMTPASAWAWRALPPLQFIQFPWRLLAVAVTVVSVMGGAVAAWAARQWRGLVVAPPVFILSALVLLAALPYTVPRYTPPNPREETVLVLFDFEREHPDMVGYLATTQQQPTSSPMLAQFEAGQPPQKFRVLSGQAEVRQLRYRGVLVEAEIRAATPATIEVMTYFYPGWQGWLDGQPLPLRPEGIYGHIAFDVPPGEHRVVLRFTDTPLRRVATLTTGLGLLVAAVLGLFPRRRTSLSSKNARRH